MAFRVYRPIDKGEFILIFADTSWAGGDACAAQFLSYTNLDIPLVYHEFTVASEMTPLLHKKAEEIYKITGIKPVLCVERNNGGVAELERLKRLNRNQDYILYREKVKTGYKQSEAEGAKLGWTTSSATRPIMLGMLKEAVDNKLITIYDRPTITEMFSFVEKQTPSGWKPQAEKNAHDDLLMALAGVWQMYQTERPPVTNRRPKRQKRFDDVTGRVLS